MSDRSHLDDPRVYLAAERTFLAWIRTALALMGFGFVVARFGLFLRELEAAGSHTVKPHGFSLGFGTSLVVMGVVLTIAAIVRHIQMLRRLEAGETLRTPSRLALGLGIALAVSGAVVSVFLVSAR